MDGCEFIGKSSGQARFRSVLGNHDEAAMAALLQTAAWNEEHVAPLRGKSVREAIDVMQENRHTSLVLIGRLKPEHLAKTVRLGDGREVTVADYIAVMGEHDAIHAGQLVPASRARWA